MSSTPTAEAGESSSGCANTFPAEAIYSNAPFPRRFAPAENKKRKSRTVMLRVDKDVFWFCTVKSDIKIFAKNKRMCGFFNNNA